MIDAIVIGGGIAGASIAFFLKRAGLDVVVIDDNGFRNNASHAAGAFINPVMGKPSAFKQFADEAFCFALRFYAEFFPHLYHKIGSLILPKFEKNSDEYAALDSFVPSSHEFIRYSNDGIIKPEALMKGGFFLPEAGIIEPHALIMGLLADVPRYSAYAKPRKLPEGWEVNGLRARAVVLATGVFRQTLPEAYLEKQIIPLWGQKCLYKAAEKPHCCISADVHIAPTNEGIAIGSTHVRMTKPIPFTLDSPILLEREARRYIKLTQMIQPSMRIGGIRSTSIDHFPIIGTVYNSDETLKQYPFLQHGARLAKNEIPSPYEGLYIHTAHGSRAFTLAPFTASLLAEHIINDTPIALRLDSARLLFRYFKKGLHTS